MEPGERDQVTAVVTPDVIPGRESDHETWARVVSASARYGATGHTFLISDPAAPTRRVLIAQFPDLDGVRAWDDSEDRDRLVKEAEGFSSLHSSGPAAWRRGSLCRTSGPSFRLRVGSSFLQRSWARTRSWF
jgi:antibiotic biosynthesis monooxygenase (ABM) superfamily enzyme